MLLEKCAYTERTKICIRFFSNFGVVKIKTYTNNSSQVKKRRNSTVLFLREITCTLPYPQQLENK